MSILRVQHLVKRFGGISAINHCNFEIAENSITSLIGPNGAGKSTMFDVITGLSQHDSGEIYFKENPIGAFPTHARAKLGIARTFQAIRVFPELTALENIILAFKNNKENLLNIFTPFKKHQKALKEKAHEYLRMIALHEKAHETAISLSYGQQKLLEIMRAVAGDADLFLLDEPAAGVNRTMLHTIINIIKRLKSEGKTIVIVEHDMNFVMDLSEKVIVMDYGKTLAEGTPSEIQNNPKVLEAYLGVKHN